jgi:holin-like protein
MQLSRVSKPPTMSFSPALRRFVRTLAQVGLIIAIWLLATWLSQHLLPNVPPGIAGIAIALGLMALGLLRREWVADGAAWLLREMLLFFVPVVIAVVQYPALFHQHGLAILFVIVVSTALVMLATGFAVDLAWRLEKRWLRRQGGDADGEPG